MQNISRDAHIPHANGMRARAAAAVFVGHLFQNADRTRSFSSPYVPNPLGSRNTSPAAYDATLLQKEMLSRSYLSLSPSLRTRVKSFLLPGPKAQRLVSTTTKKTEMEEGDDAASCKIFPHLGFHFQSEGGRDCDVRVE